MRRLGAISILGIWALSGASRLCAQELAAVQPEAIDPASFMRVYGSTEPPHAFVRFCERFPKECIPTSSIETRFTVTAERLQEIEEINTEVNREIQPETDMQHYGIADFWTLPTDGKGDCEDFALLKRHELIKRGWPSSALLMTVVTDENGRGHAVLTARTSAGDFILDNKVDEIRVWNKAPYRFLLRQSYLNPRVWMDLDPTREEPPLSIAGVDPNR